MALSVNEIMQLMDKLQQTGLQEVTLEQDDVRLTLKAKKEVTAVASSVCAAPVICEQPVKLTVSESQGNVMKSPIVGTFYAAVSPDKPPYTSVGSDVKKGDTLCIIESMKIMNEIQSEFSGKVTEILVENGQMVEYGQPLMVIG